MAGLVRNCIRNEVQQWYPSTAGRPRGDKRNRLQGGEGRECKEEDKEQKECRAKRNARYYLLHDACSYSAYPCNVYLVPV